MSTAHGRALTLLLVCALGAAGCDTPLTIFWKATQLGHNNTLVPTRAYRVDWDGEEVRAQIPGYVDYFIGRRFEDYNLPAGAPTCGAGRQCLELRRMDWKTFGMTVVSHVLELDTTLGMTVSDGALVKQAYDPDVVSFNGELWVAFECDATNISAATASACLGPLDLSGGIEHATLVKSRTVVVVRAITDGQGYPRSASVPKLVVHKGTPYVYWSTARIDGPSFLELVARGVELGQETSGSHRLLAKRGNGSLGRVDSIGSETSVVWHLGTDARSNRVTDISDVASDGTYVVVLGNVGGGDCDSPVPPKTSEGCYRMAISRSTEAIGDGIFDADRVPDGDLPSNPPAYPHFFTHPDGSLWLAAHFLVSTNASETLQNPLTLTPYNLVLYGGAQTGTVFAFPLQPRAPVAQVTTHLLL